ncbi:NUDIX domain-containing protein [Yinghuangia aomiensis]
MPIPPFVAELRGLVGGLPLLAARGQRGGRGRPGAVAPRSARGHRLLGADRRDPRSGEEPADGVVREVLEETGVVVEPEALVAVSVSPMVEYPNGDRAQYLDLVFRCRAVGGSARPADDENLAVGWFRPEQVPELDAYTRHCLELALGPGRPTVFTGGTRG